MGHYDSCREGYCAKCGQVEGHCEHTKPKKTGFNPSEAKLASKRLHMSAMSKMGIEHGSLQEKIFLGLGVGGEGGEVADAIKKLWRDGESPETIRQIRLEMADVYLYLDHLCDAMGVKPMDCIIEKLNILFFERKPEWAEEALAWIAEQQEEGPHDI